MAQQDVSFLESSVSTSMVAPRWQPTDASSALALLSQGPSGVARWNDWRASVELDDDWLRALATTNLDMQGLDLTSCNLSGLRLAGANLVATNLSDVDLGSADLTGARLDGIDFRAQRTNLKGASLRGASLRHANLEGCDVAASQLAGADVSFAKLPQGVDVERQLSVIEEASKNCRTLFFGVLGACFFTFLTIGQTNDADLLFGSGISSLPFVGTQMPTLGFYYVAPLILFGLFLYLHLYLQQLWNLVAELPARMPDGTRVDHVIYPWLLTGLTSRYERMLRDLPQDYATLRWLASLATSWLSVPLTLWYVWGRAVARHDAWLSGFQIATLLAASLMALHSFIKMRRTLRHEAGWGSRKDRLLTGGWLMGAVLATLLAVTLTYWPLREATAAWHKLNAVDPLQAAKDRLYRPAWAQVVGYHPFSLGVRARNAKLAGADLSRIDLRLADLTSADLVGARLSGSWLQGANLSGANLDRADLSRSSLVDADFTGATLNEADLTGADFVDAKGLTEAQIQSACGTRHVRATVEGYAREYWFKLKPCKAVAERLRREQQAAEERARLAKTQAEKAAAEEAARRAAEQARRAEEQTRQAEQEAKLAAEQLANLVAAAQKAAQEKAALKVPSSGKGTSSGDSTEPPFNRSAAASALNSLAASVQSCRKANGPTGVVRVVLTFAPSGRVRSANISGPPFAGTSEGGCVASIFRKAEIPPFSGEPVTVSKTFTITEGEARPAEPDGSNPY